MTTPQQGWTTWSARQRWVDEVGPLRVLKGDASTRLEHSECLMTLRCLALQECEFGHGFQKNEIPRGIRADIHSLKIVSNRDRPPPM